MPSIKQLTLALAGLSVFTLSHAQTTYHAPNQVGLAMMRLNALPLDNTNNAFSFGTGGSVWSKLRNNFRMSEVNSELVRRHENKFMTNSAYFSRTMERSRPYMYHISNEVAKRNMPAEIALLPFIESAFVTKAKSHVGASGLWQFMPATGRHYGLEQTPLYDGRHDVYAATNAALNYLEYLHGLFGDWSLALAAYNWGEGNVGRAVNRALAQGLAPTYENLKMPSETRNYVPKLLAVRNIVNNPNAYGIQFSDLENKPYFQSVSLNQPVDISAITRLAQISESEFLQLNPAFKTPVYMPKNGRKLLLPAANATTFERNFQKADKDSLLSWNVYTPYSRTSVDDIAAESGMSASELKRLNGLRTNNIPAGHSILVNKNFVSPDGSSNTRNFIGLDTDSNPHDNQMQVVPAINRPTVSAAAPYVPPPAAATPPAKVDFVAASHPAATAMPSENGFQTASHPNSQAAHTANTVTVQRSPMVQAEIAARQAQAAVQNRPNANAVTPTPATPAAPVYTPPAPQIQTTPVAAQANAVAPAPAVVTNSAAAVSGTAAMPAAEEPDALLALVQQNQSRPAANAMPSETPVAAAAPTAATTHRVEAGDTLYNISKRYNMTVQELAAANQIHDNTVRIGQVLKVGAAARR